VSKAPEKAGKKKEVILPRMAQSNMFMVREYSGQNQGFI
jgi:hypothetical protein